MAWETLVLKIPGTQKTAHGHKKVWTCPKCEGKQFAIPYQSSAPPKAAANILPVDEQEVLVLICDRCGQFIAFEGCTGDCSLSPRSKCEVCGKYYCDHCGIHEEFETEEGIVLLRYCNDHIPEWYKNR